MQPLSAPPPEASRRILGALIVICALVLAALAAFGVLVERRSRTPLIQVGQATPEWSLPSADGQAVALADLRGRPVLLVFVPSVNCPACQAQLRALQAALPVLSQRNAAVLAISTDLPAVQRAYARSLGLTFPLLSEASIAGQHPVGSAYGLYHQVASIAGPVDSNALILIDAGGIVRAVTVQTEGSLSAAQIAELVARLGG